VGARRARPVVLDAGALIAFERNERKVRTLIERAMASRRHFEPYLGAPGAPGDVFGTHFG
jgi:hypothetical protein